MTTEKRIQIYQSLGFTSMGAGCNYIADLIADKEQGTSGAISSDYSRDIGYALADDMAADLYECADHEDWDMDDVRLAFGRNTVRRLK